MKKRADIDLLRTLTFTYIAKFFLQDFGPLCNQVDFEKFLKLNEPNQRSQAVRLHLSRTSQPKIPYELDNIFVPVSNSKLEQHCLTGVIILLL